MTWTRDPDRSLRDNIMEHLRDRFHAIEAGIDGYTQTWTTIRRGPLTLDDRKTGNALSIMDVRERKSEEIGSDRCTIAVTVEFVYAMKHGDEHVVELNRLLTDVQRTMRSDIYCGGLALNVVEVGSELDIEGEGDRVVGGVTFWEVLYRHKALDPRKTRGE